MIWTLLAILAHDPITTKIMWNAEIVRIVNRRCLSCHAAGSSVDLSNYQQARPWAKAIRNQVLNRRMPPWGAVKGFGEFQNDPSLTPLELEMLNQWVEGGAPEGDPAFLPRSIPPQPSAPAKLRWTAPPAAIAKPLTIAAIRATGPTEVSAVLPGGEIQHLLWIRDSQPNWKQAYVFRTPVVLPPASRLQVTGAPVEISR